MPVCGQSDATAHAMTCPYVDSQTPQPMQWHARMWTVRRHSPCNDMPVCGQSDATTHAMTCPDVDSQTPQPMQWRARMWTVRCSINSLPSSQVVLVVVVVFFVRKLYCMSFCRVGGYACLNEEAFPILGCHVSRSLRHFEFVKLFTQVFSYVANRVAQRRLGINLPAHQPEEYGTRPF